MNVKKYIATMLFAVLSINISCSKQADTSAQYTMPESPKKDTEDQVWYRKNQIETKYTPLERGVDYTKISYTALEDNSTILGYSGGGRIKLMKSPLSAEDVLRIGKCEFEEYMATGSANVIQWDTNVTDSSDKNVYHFILRYADQTRNKITVFVPDKKDSEKGTYYTEEEWINKYR